MTAMIGYKFKLGNTVNATTLGSGYKVLGASKLHGVAYYALERYGDVYVRSEEDISLAPDPKLEAAWKVVDACEAKTVAIQAFLVAAGHFYDPAVEAYRIIAESDSQKESN